MKHISPTEPECLELAAKAAARIKGVHESYRGAGRLYVANNPTATQQPAHDNWVLARDVVLAARGVAATAKMCDYSFW